MSSEEKLVRVFIDTSYLTYMPGAERADWERLLLLSKQGKVEIHASHIAIEEFRTKHRDETIVQIERAKSALNSLHKQWRSSPISARLEPIVGMDVFPTSEDIEELSRSYVNQLVSTNGIQVRALAPSHAERVWRKYFSWSVIFRRAPPSERGERSTRDSRRKDIPDAWIYESAVDLAASGRRVVCLCRDENLSSCLREAQTDVFEGASGVLELLSSLEQGETPSGGPLVDEGSEVKTTTVSTSSELDGKLAEMESSERMLHIRILGYARWYEPLSKSDLLELLVAQDHSPDAAEIAIERLKLSGLIEEIGGVLFPADEQISEQAKEVVMPEILKALD